MESKEENCNRAVSREERATNDGDFDRMHLKITAAQIQGKSVCLSLPVIAPSISDLASMRQPVVQD